MASAPPPQLSLHMRSTDLIVREPLDYGGFGEVYLCYHVTLGQVVLKTMYTGSLRSEDKKRSLLEEGNIMASLNHERVVKLLGVIMEDRDCSLVMELLPRGNLLVMLETVSVPMSLKGRIIFEILEGMVYLTERNILHKDIKPENILVDKDFHIKIADLGLATCQTWSKLTKEESRRKSQMGRSCGARGAGTLTYMAPEHLESIHTVSTEKSDVYSFAIVVWVILTGQEPYSNARSEDHISQCVRNGNRPAEHLIPEDTPVEIIDLMKRCWAPEPQQRPTFQQTYDIYQPIYQKHFEQHVENDVIEVKKQYEGPDELLEKMKSLSVSHGCFLTDSPAPLLSSDPVEASIEDLHEIQPVSTDDQIESDARAPDSPWHLEEKLCRELQYHKHGSYNCECPSANDVAYGNQSNAGHHLLSRSFDNINIRQPEPSAVSSVQSWTKESSSQEESCYRPCAGYDSMTTSALHPSLSSPSLSALRPLHAHMDRQQSWPIPVSDSTAPDLTPGRLLPSSSGGSLQDSGSLYIQNASGIQIGNNNKLSIRGYDPSLSTLCNGAASTPIKEAIQKYEDCPVTEEHLDVLRDNIGAKWKRCARRLGLSDVEIETIELDSYRYGVPEMVHQMLVKWKMKEGSLGCTVGKLCRALEGKVTLDVIQKILETCELSS
ncbi:receptor-interacting serine/threonine-protein kinase 1 [Eucyclogobius newberryi]|uniref:receptor-interacting serine/threonine-protein kinase 1 n=1 Tax=Eucyclogobius newberryi TaxID=166745 RepID=UPI003B58D99E